MLLDYALDFPWRLKSTLGRRLACGSAGIARLRKSMIDRNLPLSIAPEMASSSEIDQSPGSSMLRPDSHRSSRPSFSREARCSSYHL